MIIEMGSSLIIISSLNYNEKYLLFPVRHKLFFSWAPESDMISIGSNSAQNCILFFWSRFVIFLLSIMIRLNLSAKKFEYCSGKITR